MAAVPWTPSSQSTASFPANPRPSLANARVLSLSLWGGRGKYVRAIGTSYFNDSCSPLTDPDNKCATRDSPCTKHIIAFGFMIGGAFLLVFCCCCVTCSKICCPSQKPPPRPPPPPACYTYRNGPVRYFGEKEVRAPFGPLEHLRICSLQELMCLPWGPALCRKKI